MKYSKIIDILELLNIYNNSGEIIFTIPKFPILTGLNIDFHYYFDIYKYLYI